MRGQGEILKAGDEMVRERLALYSRLAELVVEQEAALEEEDLERFQELAGLVTALQNRLGGGPGGPSGAVVPAGVGEDEAAEAASLLRATLARSERIHARLATLRRQAGGAIRHVETGRNTGRRYLEASGTGSASAVRKLDVKL